MTEQTLNRIARATVRQGFLTKRTKDWETVGDWAESEMAQMPDLEAVSMVDISDAVQVALDECGAKNSPY